MAATQTVAIDRVAHIGIRVRDLDRALAFYRVLGFTLSRRAEGNNVAIIRKASKSTLSSMPMPVIRQRTS
jgi:predicted enzyme related to lactoylglutathione lyase